MCQHLSDSAHDGPRLPLAWAHACDTSRSNVRAISYRVLYSSVGSQYVPQNRLMGKADRTATLFTTCHRSRIQRTRGWSRVMPRVIHVAVCTLSAKPKECAGMAVVRNCTEFVLPGLHRMHRMESFRTPCPCANIALKLVPHRPTALSMAVTFQLLTYSPLPPQIPQHSAPNTRLRQLIPR